MYFKGRVLPKFFGIIFLITFAVTIFTSLGCAASSPDSKLAKGFQIPPKEARPRAYWNWVNGDVTLAGLTRDLEEAKDKGLGGLEMWDTGALRNPGNFVPAGPPFMGEESVAAMKHSMEEAKRLGLDLGLITSSGWNAGGTWIPPELASKNLFYSSTVITGPGQIEKELDFPEVPKRCPKNADGSPKWYLDVAVLAFPYSDDKVINDISKVVNITDKFKDGKLSWNVPDGKWQIMRYVCSNNGQRLIAASPNSVGLFIDFLDPEATRFHFEYIINKLGIPKGGDPDCPLKSLEVDSMELHKGIQWTPKFPDWFDEYHGYDPVKWLPSLSGWTIKDKDTSDQFAYDYKKTVSDLLIFSHYTTGSKVCREYGLELAGEAGGPGPPIWDSCPVDALKALGNVDVPRGEFWIQSPRDIFLIKEIASASHIYGKKYVDAESWTTWRRWKDNLFVRKQLVDRAFCEGLNLITYHGYSNSPPEKFGYPGRSYHAGVDMNPQVVWWSKAKPFMDYVARCCYMLQQGHFVADVAYYYGDKAPNFWPPSAVVPEKPELEGLGKGYDYDVVNTDVILNRMSVKDGRIVLPDGMSYRVLVLPDQPDMPLEVLEKLETMVSAGATIIGPKPELVPGLKDHDLKSKKLRSLADEMWGACDGKTVKSNRYGKGYVVWGITPQQWLQKQSVAPDFYCNDKLHVTNLDYIHRQTEGTDIYFIRNKSLSPVKTECLFRIKNRSPQIWNPVDGSIRNAYVYEQADEQTSVSLHLPGGDSVFVVFEKQHSTKSIDFALRSAKIYDQTLPAGQVLDVNEKSVQVEFWQNGSYVTGSDKSKKKFVEIDYLPEPKKIKGPWKVNFDPEWGGPAEINLDKLISWTEHVNKGVKYYSGAGVYTKTFVVHPGWLDSKRNVYLDIGDVRDVAEIFVNGKSAGILWKPPYRADITSLVKAGNNELKIEVMNMWINRLIGDESLPAEKKFTSTNIRSFDSSRAKPGTLTFLQPAGLLGPVKLIPSINVTVDLKSK